MSTRLQDNFGILLDKFDSVISDYPSPETIKPKLNSLKESASLNNNLTYPQKDAIIARCDNYLSNQYGDQRKSNDSRSNYQKGLN